MSHEATDLLHVWLDRPLWASLSQKNMCQCKLKLKYFEIVLSHTLLYKLSYLSSPSNWYTFLVNCLYAYHILSYNKNCLSVVKVIFNIHSFFFNCIIISHSVDLQTICIPQCVLIAQIGVTLNVLNVDKTVIQLATVLIYGVDTIIP